MSDKADLRSARQYRWIKWVNEQLADPTKFSEGEILKPWTWVPEDVWANFPPGQRDRPSQDAIDHDPKNLSIWRYAEFIRAFLNATGSKYKPVEPPEN